MIDFIEYVVAELKSKRLSKTNAVALVRQFSLRSSGVSAGSVLHPLLHCNTSDLRGQRYSTRMRGDEFFLTDHRVSTEGDSLQKVLPGVAYLEMARAAVEQAWGGRPEGAVLELRQTVWARPIVVGDESKAISIALMANEEEQVEYEIYSQEGEQEIVHCQGRAVWSRGGESSRLDVEQLKGEMGQGEVEPSRIYAGFAGMGLMYGPGFQSITGMRCGRGQVLAQLRLPGVVEEKWGEYVLHPSLLDGGLQACVGLMEGRWEATKRPRLPFALESLRIVAGCSREMMAWVRYAPGSQAGDTVVKLDIDLCDERGHVCVEMRGFSSRELKSDEGIRLGARPGIQSGLQSLVPVWNPVHAETQQETILPGATKVLLLGGDQTQLDWVQKSHPNASLLPLSLPSTIEGIEAELKDCSFDHLLWIAPNVVCGDGRCKQDEDQVIEQQELGVLAVFRMIKALLGLGYGDKELRWTIITGKTQRVKKDEPIQPTHAGIFGLVGSVAKEYPHWNLSLLDVESLDAVAALECLSLAADKQGNGRAYRQGEWFYQELAHLPLLPQSPAMRYRQNGVYVVIGGAGGLGEVWSRFMIEHYQAKVVWIGRSKYDASIEEKINALTRLGPAPVYISADATKREALEQASETILKTYPAIHGVVHSAIVLQDQSIAGMEESEFRASLSAKVDISVNMDRVFGKQELDFMLWFSSIISFVKSPGQSNYAAGCTFKDSFAQKLQGERAYPVKIMNWGYWGKVGVVADESYNKTMGQMGIGSIEANEGMASLQTLVSSELGQMGLIKINEAQAIVDFSVSEGYTSYPKDGPDAIGQVERTLGETSFEPTTGNLGGRTTNPGDGCFIGRNPGRQCDVFRALPAGDAANRRPGVGAIPCAIL